MPAETSEAPAGARLPGQELGEGLAGEQTLSPPRGGLRATTLINQVFNATAATRSSPRTRVARCPPGAAGCG